MHQDPNANPVNPLPPVVVVLFLAIVVIEATFFLAAKGLVGGPQGIGWRLSAVQNFAYLTGVFDWMWINGRFLPTEMLRFVTYPFVHAGFSHALFVGVMLLAMGKIVGETLGNLAVLLIFFVAGIGGALAYQVFLDTPLPLMGGFPSVYGMIGGFTYLLWRNLSSVGSNQLRAFQLIGFLMGLQLIFGLLFGVDDSWVADLAGFFCGFGLATVLMPGALQNLRTRIRRD